MLLTALFDQHANTAAAWLSISTRLEGSQLRETVREHEARRDYQDVDRTMDVQNNYTFHSHWIHRGDLTKGWPKETIAMEMTGDGEGLHWSITWTETNGELISNQILQ